MNARYSPLTVLIAISALLFSGCNKAIVIKNVNYTQQVESVLTPNNMGEVSDVRYGISYSILPLQYQEFRDSSIVLVDEVRMIRNANGFYFITADGFKHVYVASPGNGEFKIVKKILVSEDGLEDPALNWRNPAVQLIAANKEATYINKNGIIKEEG